MPENLKSDTAV